MAECSGPPQSALKDVLGTFDPSLEPVDSSTPRSAPLSRCTLLRHSSFVRAVCVNAPVRICAGGDQRWSSLPRQWTESVPVQAASFREPHFTTVDYQKWNDARNLSKTALALGAPLFGVISTIPTS